MADLEKLYQDLSALTLLEAAELKKMLEERWGVTAAAPVAFAGPMPGAGAGAAAAAEPVEEQTEFTVILKEAGPNKIPIIKVVRQLTNLGLKEAKDVVESAPATLLEAVSKEVAMDAKSKLEAEGGKAEIK